MARRVCNTETKQLFLAVLIAVIFTTAVAQKLTVINLIDPGEPQKLEPGPDYKLKNLDIIWNISYPIEITFSLLDIDSQSGDFIVICEYPLPQGDKFSDGAPAEEVIHELPIEESLLLTSNALDEHSDGSKKLVVRVRSEHGAFIYFHGTKQSQEETTETSLGHESKPTAENEFEGFAAQVEYLELNPQPEVTTTTERLTTPAPGVDIYLIRHIIGRTPNEFFQNLRQFKEMIAKMGNQYCEINAIKLERPIEPTDEDVRLDNTTIFFCDRRIKNYDICVQIQLAIPIRDRDDNYVMTTPVLEDMWDTYAKGYLKDIGGKPMFPIDPEDEKPSVTWVWIAASLGVVLILATILCFAFAGGMIKSTHEPVRTTHVGLGGRHSAGSSFADPKNTVLEDIIDVLFVKRGNEDAELMRMGDTGHYSNRSSMSMPKNNPLHNMKSYDNPSFIHDENRGSFRSPSYYPGIPSGNGSSTSGHHTFQVKVQNHTPPDHNEIDSDEEMEIYNSAPGIIY